MNRHRQRVLGTAKDGTKVTEAIADELAKEAEVGYDLSKARRVGRRSLAGGRGKSPRLNIRLTPELDERLRKRADREGKSPSELAREALEEFVGS